MVTPVVLATPPTLAGRRLRIPQTVLLGVLSAFFLIAAAGPKLVGAATAVELFDDIGLGQWLRYVVGGLELAGAIGLVVPRLARPAALGLTGVMVGAILTNLFVIDGGLLVITPAVLLVLCGLVAWGGRTGAER